MGYASTVRRQIYLRTKSCKNKRQIECKGFIAINIQESKLASINRISLDKRKKRHLKEFELLEKQDLEQNHRSFSLCKYCLCKITINLFFTPLLAAGLIKEGEIEKFESYRKRKILGLPNDIKSSSIRGISTWYKIDTLDILRKLSTKTLKEATKQQTLNFYFKDLYEETLRRKPTRIILPKKIVDLALELQQTDDFNFKPQTLLQCS